MPLAPVDIYKFIVRCADHPIRVDRQSTARGRFRVASDTIEALGIQCLRAIETNSVLHHASQVSDRLRASRIRREDADENRKFSRFAARPTFDIL